MARAPRNEDADFGPDVEADGLDAETAARIEALSRLSPQDILRLMHKRTLATLLAKLEAGTASAQETAIIRNLLKDNGMILGVPPEEWEKKPAPAPAPLPSFADPEYLN